MRKLLFELGETTAVAEMHDDIVPTTCNAVWNVLPVEGMAIHANWASREIMLHLQGEKVLRLPAEGPARRDSAVRGMSGPLATNLVGTITEGIEALARKRRVCGEKASQR
jgi:hypothetical protein